MFLGSQRSQSSLQLQRSVRSTSCAGFSTSSGGLHTALLLKKRDRITRWSAGRALPHTRPSSRTGATSSSRSSRTSCRGDSHRYSCTSDSHKTSGHREFSGGAAREKPPRDATSEMARGAPPSSSSSATRDELTETLDVDVSMVMAEVVRRASTLGDLPESKRQRTVGVLPASVVSLPLHLTRAHQAGTAHR